MLINRSVQVISLKLIYVNLKEIKVMVWKLNHDEMNDETVAVAAQMMA
jgi:hypothetical protein